MDDILLREHLVTLLKGGEAHRPIESVVRGVPEAYYGRRPEDLPYSPWELLEHMRFTQEDILQFCRDPDYAAPSWPDDYWPPDAAPPAPEAWEKSLSRFLSDLQDVMDMVQDTSVDLGAHIPHGDGQTYLREVLLVADHNAYHTGQLATVRRLLGIWPPQHG